MGFLDKLLAGGGAVVLGVLAKSLYQDAQETQRRKNSPLHFDERLTRLEFIALARDIGRRTSRVKDVDVSGMTVTLRVRSISGLSTWKAEIDFNDYGHLTGDYWLYEENADSRVPTHFANAMRAEVLTRRESAGASAPAPPPRRTAPRAQEPPRSNMSPPGPFAPAPPVNVAPGWSAPGAAPKRDANRPLVVASWVVAVCTAGYMLPWAIAQSRSRSNCRAVALVNLLAEWTVIGWVVALIMACGSDPIANAAWAQQPTPQGAPRPGFYPSPSGSGGRAYWNGHAWTAPFT